MARWFSVNKMSHHSYAKKELSNLKLCPFSFAVHWAARMDYISFWRPNKVRLQLATKVNSTAKLFRYVFCLKAPLFPWHIYKQKSQLASTVSRGGVRVGSMGSIEPMDIWHPVLWNHRFHVNIYIHMKK